MATGERTRAGGSGKKYYKCLPKRRKLDFHGNLKRLFLTKTFI